MKTARFPLRSTLAPAVVLAFALVSPMFVHASEIQGEHSRTPAMPTPKWHATDAAAIPTVRMQYGAMPVQRLLELQRKNASPGLKVTQIGIGRDASSEGGRPNLPALRWTPVAGGSIARIEIRSPDAMALRVGLDVQALDDRVELRFGGSARPHEVVALMSGAEIKRLPGPGGLFWTPSTDGDTQFVEIFRPKGVPAFAVRLDAPSLSHLVTSSQSGFSLIRKVGFGDSGSCNIDTICRVGELGQAFVNAKNSVAHMQFLIGSSSYVCTGTLLADSVPLTQIPYLHTANHCFYLNINVPPNPSQMQIVANTLNTFWNYETTGCGNRVQSPTTMLSGGATYLYSTNTTDGMLLRLNNAPPPSAYFSGWNAAAMANNTSIVAIHHPEGDSKKVSLGRSVVLETLRTVTDWSSGVTEPGSSGSGIFTLNARGEYVLRGGLFGGSSSCSNPTGTDTYSRLDVDISSMRTWLEPQPTPLESNRPRLRARATSTAISEPAASSEPGKTRNAPRLVPREDRNRR
jgi:hypothetical protein